MEKDEVFSLGQEFIVNSEAARENTIMTEEVVIRNHRPISKETKSSKLLWLCSKLSRWAVLLLPALAPIFFLPWGESPVAINKELLVAGLVLIATLGLLGKILIEGKLRLPKTWLSVAVLFLLLVWFFASYFSGAPTISFWGSWGSPDTFWSMILWVLLFLIATMTLDKKDLILSCLLFLSSLALLGIFEILQLAKIFIFPWSFTRNLGFNLLGSVNDVGVLLGAGTIFAVTFLFARDLAPIFKRFLFGFLAVYLIGLFFINLWSIWVSLLVVSIALIVIIILGLGLKKIQNNVFYLKKTWPLLLILFIAIFSLAAPPIFSKFIAPPLEVAPNFTTTLSIGLQVIKTGFGPFLLGFGPNNWASIYSLYRPSSINNTAFWDVKFSQGFSALSSWVGEVGVLGILAWLLLFGLLIWNWLEAEKKIMGSPAVGPDKGKYNLTGLIIRAGFLASAFLFLMLFFYTVNFTNLTLLFWLIAVFLVASYYYMEDSGIKLGFANLKEIKIFKSAWKTFLTSLILIALIIASLTGLYFEATHFWAENLYWRTTKTSAISNADEAVSNLSLAVGIWPTEQRYWQLLGRAYFAQLNNILNTPNQPQNLILIKFRNASTNAINAFKSAIEIDPKNSFNYILLGNIYENLTSLNIGNSASAALASYQLASQVDPRNPSILVSQARIYLVQADILNQQIAKGAANAKDLVSQRNSYWNQAASLLEQAVALKVNFAPAHFLLVQVYDRQGKISDAINRARSVLAINGEDVGVLFQLGFLDYKAGNFEESRLVLSRAVELSPNYSNALYFLGLIYDRDGDKKTAIQIFEKITELNPDNQEVKIILKNLNSGKPALTSITPPPQARTDAPVGENNKAQPPLKLKTSPKTKK